MAANIGSGALVLWAFRAQMPAGMWLWWASLMLISGVALMGWAARRKRQFDTASVRAVRRATWHAATLAAAWAVMPLLWFADASPPQQLTVATLITGLLGAGTFVLSPLPLASLAYAVIFTAAALGALLMAQEPMYLGVMGLLGLYAALAVIGSLSMWRKATALLRSQAEAVRHEQMLAVLLHDFEQHAGEALWETGADGHLNHVSPRLAELLCLQAAEAREGPLLALLAQRCDDGRGRLPWPHRARCRTGSAVHPRRCRRCRTSPRPRWRPRAGDAPARPAAAAARR